MRLRIIVPSLAVIAFGLPLCAADGMNADEPGAQQQQSLQEGQQAKQQLPGVSGDELERLMREQDVLVIDLSPADQAVPGAVKYDEAQESGELDRTLRDKPPGTTVVLTGPQDDQGQQRMQQVCEDLKRRGFEDVRSYQGDREQLRELQQRRQEDGRLGQGEWGTGVEELGPTEEAAFEDQADLQTDGAAQQRREKHSAFIRQDGAKGNEADEQEYRGNVKGGMEEEKRGREAGATDGSIDVSGEEEWSGQQDEQAQDQQEMQHISGAELHRALEEDRALVLDVTPEDNFDDDQALPDALEYAKLQRKGNLEKKLGDDTSKLVVLSGDQDVVGHQQRLDQARRDLQALGFHNVKVYEGDRASFEAAEDAAEVYESE